jgi:ankyrin repeat protein
MNRIMDQSGSQSDEEMSEAADLDVDFLSDVNMYDKKKSLAENIKNSRNNADKLLETMRYMKKRANDHDNMDLDFIFALISFNDSLIETALEVLKLSPNKVSDNGKTALYAAIICQSPKAVQCLLKNGADPFQCNISGIFPMHYMTTNSPRNIRCSNIMHDFIRDLIDKEHVSDQEFLEHRAWYKMKAVESYRIIVTSLLDIENSKNKILREIESNQRLFQNLNNVKSFLHQLDDLEHVFDYDSFPGMTLIEVSQDYKKINPRVQEWYAHEEFCKIHWSHDIHKYFSLGVNRMKWLRHICSFDKGSPDIQPLVEEAEQMLADAM